MSGVGHSGQVVIAAVGARTPVGLGADASAAAWRAGISRLSEHPEFVDKAGEPVRVAMDGALDPEAPIAQRVSELATSALLEACEGLAGRGKPAAELYVATPPARPGWSVADHEPLLHQLTAAAGQHLTIGRTVPFSHGHAAGLSALHDAVHRIERGTAQICLVGGVDSWVDWSALQWLDEERRLASQDDKIGFVPGEAAAFVLVASVGAARSLQLSPLARVRGVGIAHEARTRRAEQPCLGEGLTAAIRDATAGLSLPGEKIATSYGDLNGERYRSNELMYVPMRLWAPFVDASRHETAVDAWGDVGAATAPLMLTVACVSGRRGWARGSSVLVFAGSDSGERAAASLILEGGPR